MFLYTRSRTPDPTRLTFRRLAVGSKSLSVFELRSDSCKKKHCFNWKKKFSYWEQLARETKRRTFQLLLTHLTSWRQIFDLYSRNTMLFYTIVDPTCEHIVYSNVSPTARSSLKGCLSNERNSSSLHWFLIEFVSGSRLHGARFIQELADKPPSKLDDHPVIRIKRKRTKTRLLRTPTEFWRNAGRLASCFWAVETFHRRVFVKFEIFTWILFARNSHLKW